MNAAINRDDYDPDEQDAIDLVRLPLIRILAYVRVYWVASGRAVSLWCCPAMEPTLCKGIMLSDSVIREHGTGKLSLIGCFTAYNFPMLPFVAPPFVVTVLVTNLEGRLQSFPITVRIEAPGSGHVLASSMAQLNSEVEVPRSDIFEVPIAVGPINYVDPGIYKVKVLAQNEDMGDRDLTVRKVGVTQS
jgi:hypothetical protein